MSPLVQMTFGQVELLGSKYACPHNDPDRCDGFRHEGDAIMRNLDKYPCSNVLVKTYTAKITFERGDLEICLIDNDETTPAGARFLIRSYDNSLELFMRTALAASSGSVVPA